MKQKLDGYTMVKWRKYIQNTMEKALTPQIRLRAHKQIHASHCMCNTRTCTNFNVKVSWNQIFWLHSDEKGLYSHAIILTIPYTRFRYSILNTYSYTQTVSSTFLFIFCVIVVVVVVICIHGKISKNNQRRWLFNGYNIQYNHGNLNTCRE